MTMKAALLACAFILSGAAHAQEISAERIDALSQQTIEALDLTGLAVTVVSHDKVLFTKTYGLRDVRGTAKVDAQTLLPFGSIGKAFTTAALATLVDEGKLAWDDPVKKYIPEFEMSDPYISNQFTVRDLVTHRSGLPLGAGDLLFVPDAESTVEDILAAIKHIPPATSFRSEFAYDNSLYVLAGEVLSRVDRRPWHQAIRERLFKPIGMASCEALPSKAASSRNTVTQHAFAAEGKDPAPIDPRYILADYTAPAGGLSCSVSDFAKWAQFWLNKGTTASGKKLISDAQLKELWTGVTPTAVRPDFAAEAGTHFSLYGLGWNLNDFHGELLVSHGGGVLGAVSNFAILPEKDIAVFVSANNFAAGISALPLQFLSEYVAPDAKYDWIAGSATFFANYRANAAKDSSASDAREPAKNVDPARPLADYVGEYRDPWYGPVVVSVKDGSLFLDMGRSEALDAWLAAVDADKFLARWPDRSLNADAYVTFTVENGSVIGMTMKAVSTTTDFSFDFHDLKFSKAK